MTLTRAHAATPVGPMLVLASDEALCALEFSTTGRMSRLNERLARWYGKPSIADGDNDAVRETRRWLERYFAGESAEISGLTFDMRGGEFERRVWAALRRIPPGTTTSYGNIAKQLGDAGSSRAVGMANGANPVAIIVPCHRVIGSNGNLTGYGGGLERKSWLLEHEKRHFFALRS
jgi:methylated-DNA-[protein]-cysteine S-methyltransferase